MIRNTFVILAITLLASITYAQNAAPAAQAKQTKPHPGLKDPKLANEKAPAKFDVEVVTTKGNFTISVNRDWSPNGADRFYNLVKIGYFQDIGIFRAIEGFMFQFGIHGDPQVNAVWGEATFPDDKPKRGVSNRIGTITFAKTQFPNSRSTQFFINLRNNDGLDYQGFTPFGVVSKGKEVITKINTEYGENPRGENIQGRFKDEGNSFIKKRFPRLDFIKSIKLAKPQKAAANSPVAGQ